MVQIRQKTECSFIPPVISKYTARVYTWRNRVLQRALKRLELLDAKVSRAVLRGRDSGNTILLPDTDVKDAEWIADLLQHGLLKASFVPSGPQRELRDLTRYRVRLTEEKAREVNRVQKTLEDTNLKLGDVGSSIMGKASRMILHAIADGETDPGRLAALAVGRVRAPQEQLEAALRGTITDHHRFLLTEHLTQIRHLEQAIERVTAEIARRFTPPPEEAPSEEEKEIVQEGSPASVSSEDAPSSFQATLSWAEAVVLLCSIPGISERTAIGILAEIGINMRQFPTAGHLASWAGICPGHRESAGKRLSGKTRHPAIPGYDVSWFRPLIPHLTRSGVIWPNNIVALRNEEEANGLQSPSLTVSWSLSITS